MNKLINKEKALHFMKIYTASELGRSMVEMLGVLAIIGVLSGAGLAGYSQAMKRHRLNQTLEQIQLIVSNVRGKSAHSRRVQINSLEEAIKMGIFPEEMVKSATELELNKYKGEITFEKVVLDGKNVYKLSFKGLPDDVAMQLSTMDWSNSSMLKIMFNGDAEDVTEEEGE